MLLPEWEMAQRRGEKQVAFQNPELVVESGNLANYRALVLLVL